MKRITKLDSSTEIDILICNIIVDLSDEDKEWIKSLRVDDLISLHYNVGRWIRNRLELWHNKELCQKFKEEMGSDEPDEISQWIIEKIWKKL